MKTKIPFKQARPLAERIRDALAPACERVHVAGSVRRGKAMVGDIELVAVPLYVEGVTQGSLFDEEVEAKRISRLDGLLNRLIEEKPNFRRGGKNGSKYKNFVLQIDEDGAEIGIDLFITTAEQFGYIFAIRTGPQDFSKALVTRRSDGGLLPNNMRCLDGWLHIDGERVATPDEADFFAKIGLMWLPPHERDAWRKALRGADGGLLDKDKDLEL